MKIIHLVWSGYFGGITKIAVDLVEHQELEKNISSDLLIMSNHKGEYSSIIDSLNFNVYQINIKNAFDISFKEILKIYKIFKKYDIIHFHTFNPTYSVLAFISGKKIVYSFHGLFGYNKKTLRYKIKRFLEKIFVKYFVDLSISNSRHTYNFYNKLFRLNPNNNNIVYNGIKFFNKTINVDEREFIINKIHVISQQKFIIGVSCRLVPLKRVEILLEAFSRFSGLEKSHLVVVGEGPCRDKLEYLSKTLNIDSNVTFTGYIQNIYQMYRLFDLGVLPFFKEGFGLVAVEFLYLGIPVVVLEDGGGLVEIISNYCKEDVVNEEELLGRINFYFKNHNFKNKDRIKYAESFSLESMNKKILKLYEKSLNKEVR